jgi:hypothetical protein
MKLQYVFIDDDQKKINPCPSPAKQNQQPAKSKHPDMEI